MSAPDAGLSRQAIKLYQSGRFREAEQLFRRLLETDGEDWQYALMLGLCRHAQGDMEQASQYLRRAIELGDAQPTTHYYYGRLLNDMERPREAREQFAQAVALDPNHVEARTAMGLLSLIGGDFERAVGELRTALRANDKHAPAHNGLARALLELGEVEEASAHAARALELDGNNPVAQDTLGQAFLRAGQYHFAEQCLNNVLKLRPERGATRAALGELLTATGRHAEALEQFRAAMQAGHGGPKMMIDMSVCLERVGQHRQARDILEQAHERWNDDVDLAVRLAEHCLETGDTAAAGEVLEKLDAGVGEVAVMRARLAEAAGERERARELLERVVGSDADAVEHDARIRLARLIAADAPADATAAREPLAPLLDRKTPLPDAVLAWAGILERAGQPAEAIEQLESLLERDGLDEVDRRSLHNRLGNLHDRADEPAAAWAHWQAGGWRPAPHVKRLQSQYENGVLGRWLEAEWQPPAPMDLDDGYPAPVIVAGWPGSGRELIVAGLGAHPAVQTLDPEGEERRLDALTLPVGPAKLGRIDEAALRVGRKRFMRGVRREQPAAVTLDGGWYEASAIPALARFFPGLTVIWPEADADDLLVQWHTDGYLQVDRLVEEYAREMELWQRLRERLALNVIETSREALLADLPAELERVFGALGLAAEPAAVETAERLRAGFRFVPTGRGARYRPRQ